MCVSVSVLANKLGPASQYNIRDCQTWFIRNRSILDRIALAKEVIHQTRKKEKRKKEGLHFEIGL